MAETKDEAKVETAGEQRDAELVQLVAAACPGGQIALDPELFPHLAALMQRVTGQGPILPVTAPREGKDDG